MNTESIIKLFKDNYNIVIGEDFIPNSHASLNIDIAGIIFELNVGVNVSTGKISFISMYLKTNDKEKMLKSIDAIINHFKINVNMDKDIDFSNVTVYLISSGIDNELNISVKLKLFDWISSLAPRYKVELMLEGE